MFALLVLALVVVANCEQCEQASDCKLEDCGSENVMCVGAQNGVKGTCTCGSGHVGPVVETGDACQTNTDCHSDSKLHCRLDERYCDNNVCSCHVQGGMPNNGGLHGNMGFLGRK